MEETSEAKIQADSVLWLWNRYPDTRRCFFAVYNNPKNRAHGSYLKSLGMLPGVSDTIFAWKSKIYFIEFKTIYGRQSEDQKKFQYSVEEQGFCYSIVRSLHEFQNLIVDILTN